MAAEAAGLYAVVDAGLSFPAASNVPTFPGWPASGERTIRLAMAEGLGVVAMLPSDGFNQSKARGSEETAGAARPPPLVEPAPMGS